MIRSWVRRLALPALSITVLTTLCACASTNPVPLAANVDMNRMYGGWYLAATIPNNFEKGMVQPYDVYSKRPDGNIREDFYVRRGSFEAPQKHLVARDSVKPGTGNAHWRVIWPLNLPFLILYADPDYRYVLYGEDSRALGWIYSRTQVISDEDYQAALRQFQAAGYDPTRFRKIIQTPQEIGQPGFWSDGVKAAGAQ